jgi:hypothetical protein
MPRADDFGSRLVKQDRRTIRREHAERDAGSGGDQPVGARRFLAAPWPFHGDDRGAVDLARGHQTIGRQAEAIHRDRSVAYDPVRQIARAEAAIERCERAFADATQTGEKAVADAGIGARAPNSTDLMSLSRVCLEAGRRRHTRRGQCDGLNRCHLIGLGAPPASSAPLRGFA